MSLMLIGLMLPEKFIERVNKLKKIVFKNYGNLPYLNNPPHLTLFLGEFWEDKIFLIDKELERISRRKKPFKMEIEGINFLEDKVWKSPTIAFIFKKNRNFRDVQKEVIEKLNEYRNKKSPIDKNILNAMKRFSKEEIANLKKYGYPYSWNNWVPHVTITTTKKTNFKSIFNLLKKFDSRFKLKINGLTLYIFSYFAGNWLKAKDYKFKG